MCRVDEVIGQLSETDGLITKQRPFGESLSRPLTPSVCMLHTRVHDDISSSIKTSSLGDPRGLNEDAARAKHLP